MTTGTTPTLLISLADAAQSVRVAVLARPERSVDGELVPVLAMGSLTPVVAPLRHHVGGVVRPGAQEQMTGSNAGRVVAVVKHAERSGIDPVLDDPGDDMGQSFFALPSVSPMTHAHRGARPGPAVIGLIDSGPEPLKGVVEDGPQRDIFSYVASLVPTHVVGLAPATDCGRSLAGRNCTGRHLMNCNT